MKPSTIPRKIESAHGLSFDELRLRAVEIAQETSGKTWTDYNPHDPGVTILEHLCYGLTDLGYRLGFDVADLLCDPQGRIDFRKQALFTPEQILPGAPVTSIDFRKRLYSDFHEIQDVRIEPIKPGYSRVLIRTQEKADLAGRIARAMRRDRPLGEDFEQVRIMESSPCWLAGEITWDGRRDPTQVYADIHFRCGHRIASDIRFRRYDELLATGRTLEELIVGPLTPQGHLEDADFREANRRPGIAELVKVAETTPGVRKVRKLFLVGADGSPIVDSDAASLHLEFPTLSGTRPILLLAPGCMSPLEPFLKAAGNHLRKLEFGHQALRRDRDISSQLPSPPTGVHRDISRYKSIQEDFPGAYGIGVHGIPDGAPPQARAHAKQLKAYLYPFEQIMLDFLGTVEDLPGRFSIAPSKTDSYRSRDPRETRIPRIEQVLVGPDVGDKAKASLSRMDEPSKRRNRLLDTMLAQYGESFPEHLLRNFNPYHRSDADAWVCEAKERYLRHLPELTSRRADPRLWRLRVAILLGLSNLESHRKLSGYRELSTIQTHEAYIRHADTIPVVKNEELVSIDRIPDGERVVLAKLPRMSDRMFRSGCDDRRYFAMERPNRTAIAFHEGGAEPAYVLGSFESPEVAKANAKALRDRLLWMNRECEGFHLVEHILLRPRTTKDPFVGIATQWFTLRVSIVFPCWTARFADPEFRDLAEEIVASTLPAHVQASFYWLDLPLMREFEALELGWRRAYLQSRTAPQALRRLDMRSSRLARFLLDREIHQPSRNWF